MYLNIEYIHNKGFNAKEVLIMQLLKQNRSEDMENYLAMYLDDETLERFDKEDILDRVKKKRKNDSDFSVMRLSKKGQEILENAETPEINEDDIRIADWLKDMYIQAEKEIGNFKRTKMLIAEFRAHSGIQRNNLAFLCKHFMADEKEWQYTQRLEYLFWKKEHMYNTKFDINQSRLYQYYLKNKDFFDKKFKTL